MAVWLFVNCAGVLIASGLCEYQDGGKAPRIALNDGNFMPVMGLGTFLGFDEKGQRPSKENEVERIVAAALEAGYRLIDTAQAYGTEDQIGAAIRASSVPREHVFIVTKLAPHRQREIVPALRDSLKSLNTSYVDLYLIHQPVAFQEDRQTFDLVDYVDTWKGMVEAQELGLTKSIGVSNFNMSQIERLMNHSKVVPAVLQVEVNVNLAQDELLEFCKKHNIGVMAYAPFGGLFSSDPHVPPPRMSDLSLMLMGSRINKTIPQIILKYLVQRGVVPIPKSLRVDRIKENIEIFDFELGNDDLKILADFNANYRTVLPSFWQKHPYYPFEQTEEPGKNLFHPKAD